MSHVRLALEMLGEEDKRLEGEGEEEGEVKRGQGGRTESWQVEGAGWCENVIVIIALWEKGVR